MRYLAVFLLGVAIFFADHWWPVVWRTVTVRVPRAARAAMSGFRLEPATPGQPSVLQSHLRNGAAIVVTDSSKPLGDQVAWSEQHDRLTNKVVDLANQVSSVSAELALERKAHKQTKIESAERDLRDSANLKWPTGESPSVVVRFFGYGKDHDLAQRIREIVEKFLGWPVTLDGSNKPTLPKAGDFKVVFVSGTTTSFKRVALAFVRGELIGEGVAIGGREFDDSIDFHRLEIHVLPDGTSA